MSTPQSAVELVQLIQKSRVIDEQDLTNYFAKNPLNDQTPQELARVLIERGLLTSFQAELLLQGKWKNFIIAEKYRLLEHIGSGGMGRVYLCEHLAMRRRVAIKVLPTDKATSASNLQRFRREARAAAALDHPNIVRAYDIDSTNNLLYIVMEYVDGTNLHELVEKFGPLPVVRAAHYIAQTALGLQHAHEAGLIHRDIKPANLLLDRSGTIKILDLGLARFQHDTRDALTAQHDRGAILGTADFLAPEQAVNSTAVDIRADIYSLGLTFYFLLTGKIPFADLPLTEKLIAQQTRPPQPLSQLRPELPAALLAVIDRMLAKRPEQRYQQPSEVAQALLPWTSQPIEPPPAHEMPTRSARSRGLSGLRQPQPTAVVTSSSSRVPTVSAAGVSGNAYPVTQKIDSSASPSASQFKGARPKVVAASTPAGPGTPASGSAKPAQPITPNRPLSLRILRYTVAGLSLAVIAYLGIFVIPAEYSDLQKSLDSRKKLEELAKQQPPPPPPPPPPAPPPPPPPPGSKLSCVLHEIKANEKLDRISYSNKLKRFVTAGLVPSVAVVWDAESRQPLAQFPHPAGVRFVDWHPKGLPQFVTACNDGGVRIFDVEKNVKLREWTEDKNDCLVAVYSPAGLLIAAGGRDQVVHVWEIESGKARCHLKQHTDTINGIAWLPDGKRLISSAYDRTALLWDVSQQRVLEVFSHEQSVMTHAVSRDGKLLATGESSGKINLWKIEPRELLFTNHDLKNMIWFVAFSSDSRRLAAAGVEKKILVFDVPSWRRIAELTGHSDGISGLAWLPDGKSLMSVSLDQSVRIWQIER